MGGWKREVGVLWEMGEGVGTRFALANVRVGLRKVLRIIGGANDWFVWEICWAS